MTVFTCVVLGTIRMDFFFFLQFFSYSQKYFSRTIQVLHIVINAELKTSKHKSHLNQKKLFSSWHRTFPHGMQAAAAAASASASVIGRISTSRKINSRLSRCANKTKWCSFIFMIFCFVGAFIAYRNVPVFYSDNFFFFVVAIFCVLANHVHSHQRTLKSMKRMSDTESWSGQCI